MSADTSDQGTIPRAAQERLAELRAQRERKQQQYDELDHRFRHGLQGGADVAEVTTLRTQIDQLDRYIAEAQIECEVERRAEVRERALNRLKAIRRAVGSFRATQADFLAQFVQAAAELKRCADELNAKYRKAQTWRSEYAALKHFFELDDAMPDLGLPPGQDEGVRESLKTARNVGSTGIVDVPRPIRPMFEENPNGNGQQRRSFEEISGSEGHRLISEYGIDWPEETARQKQRREAVERSAAEERASAERVTTVSSGHVI